VLFHYTKHIAYIRHNNDSVSLVRGSTNPNPNPNPNPTSLRTSGPAD